MAEPVEEPLPCTHQLLTALQQRPDGWAFDLAELGTALDSVVAGLTGPDVAKVIRQFFGVVGLLVEQLNRQDLAQQLVDGLAPRIKEDQLRHIRGLLADEQADRNDALQSQFERLTGQSPHPAEPKLQGSGETVDVPRLKGPIRG